MFSIKRLGRTKVPHHKATADMPAVVSGTPKQVLLPMAQHIGAPAVPTVKVGDTVKVGQMIAEAQGAVSAHIHATVSGTVVKIDDYRRFGGKRVPAITIESDGLMTLSEGITPPVVEDIHGLIDAVRQSGLVGLGGAGFPTAVKLGALINPETVDTVIINGAECEPFMTCDTRTMLDDAKYVRDGIDLLRRVAPHIKKFIIGIETNKKKCIAEMKEIFSDSPDVKIASLKPLYPQGGEKVIIYNTTKRVVPIGKLPSDVGIIVMNVTSLAFMAKYVETGMPLVSRTVTVDGSAVKEPKNLIVPIGTSLEELIELAGGLKEPVAKALFGGPMMGYPAEWLTDPIVKTVGGVTLLNAKDSVFHKEGPCINCGRCIDVCPHLLNPVDLSRALATENKERQIALLEKFRVDLCVECGCCSFVCPARRPLVQFHRIGKKELQIYKEHVATLDDK